MAIEIDTSSEGGSADARLQARKSHEDANLFSRLQATHNVARQNSLRYLRSCGDLSVVEWRTLWDLHEVGPLSVRDLAAIQRNDHSLISRALPAMRRKGFVTMRRDERDGRQTVVALAEAGRAAYLQAAPVMASRRRSLRSAFTEDELAQFVSLLDRLEAFLQDDELHPRNAAGDVPG